MPLLWPPSKVVVAVAPKSSRRSFSAAPSAHCQAMRNWQPRWWPATERTPRRFQRCSGRFQALSPRKLVVSGLGCGRNGLRTTIMPVLTNNVDEGLLGPKLYIPHHVSSPPRWKPAGPASNPRISTTVFLRPYHLWRASSDRSSRSASIGTEWHVIGRSDHSI